MLWVRKWLILTLLGATLLVTYVVGKQLPPRYEGRARIVIEAMRPDPVTGQAIDSKAFGAYMNTQLQLIQSYRVTGQVVDMAGMTNSPQLAEIFQSSGASMQMDFRRWIANQLAVRVGAIPDPESNILTIIFVSGDPVEAASFADLFRTAFIDQSRQEKVDPAIRRAQAMRESLGRTRVQLAAAEKRLADFERQNGIVAAAFPMGMESEQLRGLARKLPAAEQSSRRRYSAVTMAARLKAASRIASLDAAIVSASATLGPNHPQVVALSSERNAIAAASSGIALTSNAVPAAPVVNSSAALAAAYSEAQRRTLAARGTIDEASRLTSDVMRLRRQSRDIAEQAMAYDMVAGSMEAGLVSVGDVEPPKKASFPNWPVLMTWAMVIGLGYAIPIALMAELRRLRVRNSGDIDASGIPIVGRAPPPVRAPWRDRFRAPLAALRRLRLGWPRRAASVGTQSA